MHLQLTTWNKYSSILPDNTFELLSPSSWILKDHAYTLHCEIKLVAVLYSIFSLSEDVADQILSYINSKGYISRKQHGGPGQVEMVILFQSPAKVLQFCRFLFRSKLHWDFSSYWIRGKHLWICLFNWSSLWNYNEQTRGSRQRKWRYVVYHKVQTVLRSIIRIW